MAENLNSGLSYHYCCKRRISRRATVPGRYLWGFLTPPVAGADLRAALVANCLRGALPPVDLRAVCLVRAILKMMLILSPLPLYIRRALKRARTFSHLQFGSRNPSARQILKRPNFEAYPTAAFYNRNSRNLDVRT